MAHYYTIHGQLIDRVPMKTKPGEYKDTTVTEARALNLLPSVTTLLQVMAKPAVEKWKMEQVALAASTHPYDGSDYWHKTIANKGNEIAGAAADAGTEVHQWVSALLGGRQATSRNFLWSKSIAEYVVKWLDLNGYQVIETEKTFVNEDLGFAGTVDLTVRHRGRTKRLDIKTNSFKAEKDCPEYAEHRYQLAGYAFGANADPEDLREVLYVSRENIGLIVPKLCKNPSKDERAFLSIAHAWAATHDWKFPARLYQLMMSYEGDLE